MSCVVIVGSQWGDEGKGKIVDMLTERVDIVARYQGGNNAGHTVMFHGKTFILHLVPSGIFRPGKLSVIGNGVVVDPEALVTEIAELRGSGVEIGENLKISDEANLIMPYHKALDKLRETLKGAGKIGTTGRGIGPAYEDKMARSGVRFSEFRRLSEKAFCERLKSIIEEKNVLMRSHFKSDAVFDVAQIFDRYAVLYEQIKPHLCDASVLINDAIDQGKSVMFEGAQGTMLDVDHGTYPFVTSSSTTAGGACTGTGVGPTRITGAVGIAKAYTTRVGEGPFPTELKDETGKLLQERGKEVGATTGRVRRCGWFDALVLREAVRVNGMSALAIMKLDVLDTLATIKIAVGYEDDEGQRYERIPHWMGNWDARLTPIYEELPGWQTSTRGITDYGRLPAATRAYLERIAALAGVPIAVVSTGPRREETIVLRGLR